MASKQVHIEPAAPKKRIYLNFFDHGCVGSHMSPGQWRQAVPSIHPSVRPELIRAQPGTSPVLPVEPVGARAGPLEYVSPVHSLHFSHRARAGELFVIADLGSISSDVQAEMLDDDNFAWGRPSRRQHSKAKRARS